jgi:chromosome segregation ATPase
MSNQQQDWELLDPQLKDQINNLNKTIINLTEENKKVREQISDLNEHLTSIKKLNVENRLMFNQIKEFLEIGRTKYLKGFETIQENIKEFEHNYDKKLEKIQKNINKHTDDVFDPNYRMRMNNIRWRNTLSQGVKDYINNPI